MTTRQGKRTRAGRAADNAVEFVGEWQAAVDLVAALDDARTAVAKTDALAHALETMFDDAPWGGEIDQQRLERLAHLVGATAAAAAAALVAVDTLNADLLNPPIPPASTATRNRRTGDT